MVSYLKKVMPLKKLVIIGAGGYGREIASVAPSLVGFGRAFVLKGFLDRKSDALDGFPGYPPVLGTPEDYVPAADDVFFVAIGNAEMRRRNAEIIAARGGVFQTLVHRTAELGRNVTVGEGSYISSCSVLTADIRIGRQTFLFQHVVLGHDCVVGDYASLYAQVFLGGCVQIGAGASLYPGAKVAPFRKVGDGASVGLGSAVLTNVRAGTTVFGVPALEVRHF